MNIFGRQLRGTDTVKEENHQLPIQQYRLSNPWGLPFLYSLNSIIFGRLTRSCMSFMVDTIIKPITADPVTAETTEEEGWREGRCLGTSVVGHPPSLILGGSVSLIGLLVQEVKEGVS